MSPGCTQVVVYYFLDEDNKETYHAEVCGGGQKEGTVTEKDGKKWITPPRLPTPRSKTLARERPV